MHLPHYAQGNVSVFGVKNTESIWSWSQVRVLHVLVHADALHGQRRTIHGVLLLTIIPHMCSQNRQYIRISAQRQVFEKF